MTGLDRDTAKATNFAKIYGAGVRKMAEMIGKPLDGGAGHRQRNTIAKLPFVATPLHHLPGEGVAHRLHRAL